MNAKAEGPDNVTGGGFLPLEPEWGYKGRTFNLGQSTTSAIFARIAALYGKMVLRRTHFPTRSQTKNGAASPVKQEQCNSAMRIARIGTYPLPSTYARLELFFIKMRGRSR